MVISISSGKRQVRASDSMLMQLPTPARLHQQRGALAAEPGAGGKRHALLLGGEHHVADCRVGAAALDQPGMAGIGHIADLADVGALERVEQPVGPIGGAARS